MADKENKGNSNSDNENSESSSSSPVDDLLRDQRRWVSTELIIMKPNFTDYICKKLEQFHPFGKSISRKTLKLL